MGLLSNKGSVLLPGLAFCLIATSSTGRAQTATGSASRDIVLTAPVGANTSSAATTSSSALAQPAVTSSGGSASTPPEIQELARALKYNPQLIYEYIYNNIKILPAWGSEKGSLGAVLDGSGTVVDSAELMLQLLQLSTTHNSAIANPQLVVGTVTLTGQQLSNWLNMTSGSSMRTLLDSGLFSTVQFTMSGDTATSATISWAWVTAQVNGATVTYDPSTKAYTTWQGFGADGTFLSSSSYNSSTFYSDATSGSSNTGYAVSGLASGYSNLTADIVKYAAGVAQYIKANPLITPTQAVGGSDIVPLAPQPAGPPTAQGTLTAGASYSYVPDNYRTEVAIAVAGNELGIWNTSDLYGHRLTLSFDANGRPQVILGYPNSAIGTIAGGPSPSTAYTVLAKGSAISVNSTTSVVINVNHEPASSCVTCSGSASLQVATGYNTTTGTYFPGVYSVVLGFGGTDRGLVEKHRKQLTEINFSAPGQPNSEPTLGESLTILGDSWLAEKSQAQKVLSGASGTDILVQQEIGLVGLRAFSGVLGPYLDIPAEDVSVIQRTQRTTDSETPTLTETGAFNTDQLLGSRIESAIIEQTQPGTQGISTTELLAIEARTGNTIFDAGDPQVAGDTCSYYANTIRPQLTPTWLASDIATMDSYLGYVSSTGSCSAGDNPSRIMITKNSGPTQGAYLLVQTQGTYIQSFISGGYSGGDTTTALTPAQVGASAQVTVYPDSQTPIAAEVGGLPGGVGNGDSFTYSHTDMSTGSGRFPYKLSFSRNYDSSQRLVAESGGDGWSSNLAITALQSSDPFEGLGSNSALSATSAIAALYAAKDVLTPQSGNTLPTGIQIDVGAELVDYLIGSLTNNVLTVTRPRNIEHFVKQAGTTTFAPPLGSADSVTLNSDQSLWYYTKHGVSMYFDQAGNLSTWNSTKGPIVTITYNNPGTAGEVPTRISNNMGRSLSISYSGSPSLVSQVADGFGRFVTYHYGSNSDLTQVVDLTGGITTYGYDADNHLTQVVTPAAGGNTSPFSITYDTLDRIETTSDALNRTTSYYLSGTRSEVDDPLGDAIIDYFDPRKLERASFDAVGNETSYAYNPEYQLTQVTRPEKDSTQYQYDSNANIIQRLDTPKPGAVDYHPGGGQLATRSRSFTYDTTFNELLTSTDYAGNKTSYALNANGTVATVTLPAPSSGATAPVYSYGYNSYGKPNSMTKPDGTVTTSAYDEDEDLTSTTVDAGSGHLNLETRYAYDITGNLTSIIDPKGNTTSYSYDSLRRQLTSTLPADAQGNTYTASMTYSPNGQVASMVQPVAYTGASTKTLLTRTTTYTYDLAGELTSVLDPTGDTTSYVYDGAGRQTQVTQGVYIKSVAYDADGRPTTISKGTSGNLQPVASYDSYNPNGTLGQFCYWNAGSCINTIFTLDGYDRAARTTYPDGTVETHAYTYDNDPDYFQNRAGPTITFSYDALHRLTQKTGDPTVSYTYDSLGRRLSAALASGAGTWTYSYDTAGRLSTTVQPGAASITYGWDASSNMTSMQVAADAAPGAAVAGGTEYVGYDALNRPVSFSGMSNFQSSATQFWTDQYDALGRLQLRQYNEAPNTSSLSSTWSYDNQGIGDDISQIVHMLGNATATLNYGYDNSHRLTSFDELSNGNEDTLRPSATSSKTSSYDSSNRPIFSACADSPGGCFDKNGNLQNDGVRTFTYDQEGDGRIITATNGSTTASYGYDPDGRRVSKTVNGTTTTYVLNAAGQEVGELSGGQIQHFYLHSAVDTAPVAVIDGASNLTFNHMDRIGSIIGTSALDKVVGAYGYTPYGVSTGGLSGTAFGFAGYRWDAETGLYHTQTRSYDPVMARFIQTDPIGYAGGRNLYAYTNGDPINNVDPNGTDDAASDSDDNQGAGGSCSLCIVGNSIVFDNTQSVNDIRAAREAAIGGAANDTDNSPPQISDMPSSTTFIAQAEEEDPAETQAEGEALAKALKDLATPSPTMTPLPAPGPMSPADLEAVNNPASSLFGDDAAPSTSNIPLSSADSFGNPNALEGHFQDHGADFGSASGDGYAAQASQFFQQSQQNNLPTLIDPNGTIRVIDPDSNTFGAFNPDGTTKTFFKPLSPTYFSTQKGVPPTIIGGGK